jgi:hypothetical protein
VVWFGLARFGLVGLAAGWTDLLHVTLCQESVREQQGDTKHEVEWFGLARFGLVGLAAGWTDLLHAIASSGICQRTARRYSA